MELDCYEILGIDHYATPHDIKKSFRDLARQWHPDKNDSPLAPKKFQRIFEAYEILRDPAHRAAYDSRLLRRDARIDEQLERWSAEARKKGERYSRSSFEKFSLEIFPDLRAILFGVPRPDLTEIMFILVKMFVLATFIITLVEAARFFPRLALATARFPVLAPLLILAAIAALLGFLILFAGPEILGLPNGRRVLVLLFSHEERLSPLAWSAFALLSSLLVWLIFLHG